MGCPVWILILPHRTLSSRLATQASRHHFATTAQQRSRIAAEVPLKFVPHGHHCENQCQLTADCGGNEWRHIELTWTCFKHSPCMTFPSICLQNSQHWSQVSHTSITCWLAYLKHPKVPSCFTMLDQKKIELPRSCFLTALQTERTTGFCLLLALSRD